MATTGRASALVGIVARWIPTRNALSASTFIVAFSAFHISFVAALIVIFIPIFVLILRFVIAFQHVLAGGDHVPVMQKGIFPIADINKSRLQRRFQVFYFSFID